MRRFKIIAIIFVLSCGVLAAGIYYLNAVFIPGPFKKILIAKARAALNRDIRIKELGFNITKGVFLKGIRIADKDPQAPPFLTAEEISLGLPLPNFFLTKNIVIPFATIRKPVLHISRLADGQWNFSDLLPASGGTQKPSPPKTSPAPCRRRSALVTFRSRWAWSCSTSRMGR